MMKLFERKSVEEQMRDETSKSAHVGVRPMIDLFPFRVMAMLILFSFPGSLTQAAEVSSITTSELADFDQQPAPVQQLIERALDLTRMDLGYQYGSADPENGGMDCSGTMNYLLRSDGISGVPRQANQMYVWAWKAGGMEPVASSNFKSVEFSRLKPGDLLFWSGTYDVKREPPITHVMMYLGKLKDSGRPVMFGASSGRRYEGESRHGVSVFNLDLPRAGSKSRFIGYGPIPGMAERIQASRQQVRAAEIVETEVSSDPF